MTAAVASRGQPLSQERDYNHATDSEYKRLRDLADQAYKKRQQLSQQSQNAYKNGDRSGAHTLSEQAKEQLQVAEKYNLQAAEFVFTQNNADSSSNEIDLHGLYTKEAVWILQKRIAAAVSARESVLKVIVGKGLHSANGIAKIKPAVEDLCQQANLPNYVDSKNAGVLVIELQTASVPASWSSTDYATYAHARHPNHRPVTRHNSTNTLASSNPSTSNSSSPSTSSSSPITNSNSNSNNPSPKRATTTFCLRSWACSALVCARIFD